MKTIILTAIALSTGICSYAQNISQSAVPSAVVNVFHQQFPKAADVEWEKKGDLYEVEFETGAFHRDHVLTMDAAGKVMGHTQEIPESEIPEAVILSIRQAFFGYKIDDPEKTTDANGKTSYKVELEKQNEEWIVTFSPDGKMIEKIPG